MSELLDHSEHAHEQVARDWRKGMSDNIAYALLVYTGLQIFGTVNAMKDDISGIMPYLALIVLVGLIIPACRWFEKRWQGLSDEQASDLAYYPAYKRDRLFLWLLAVGLPLVFTGIFLGIVSLFS